MNNMNNTQNEVRYVGIDPSTKTGLVVLDKEGSVIQSGEIVSQYKDDPERMLDLIKRVGKYLNCSTDVVFIEGFSHGSKGRFVGNQYGIGWLFRAMLHSGGYEWYEVSPKTVKKFATGNGNANKDAVISSVKEHWDFEHLNKNGKPNDNVTDAYAIARFAYTLRNEKDYEKLGNKQKESIINYLKEFKK